MSLFNRAAVDAICADVVGRRNEIDVVVAALAAERHVFLEGPPGTGKSSLLRALAHASGVELVFVEGNAELTPARLVGTFDPARVLTDGYSAEVFLDGPLVDALRTGSLLYIEEINLPYTGSPSCDLGHTLRHKLNPKPKPQTLHPKPYTLI